MKSYAQRRTIGITICALCTLGALAVFALAQGTLSHSGLASGWILIGMITYLALYNVRKALPFLPLGSSSLWLQFHIYVGLLTFVIFAIHVGFRIPNGIFECLLGLTYLLVFCSGLLGLWMTRAFPKKLTALGQEVIFEHIPVVKRQLRVQIEDLLLPGEEPQQTALAEFYRDRIFPFLQSNGNTVSYLILGTSPDYQRLSRAITDQHRYLNDEEGEQLEEVEQLVRRQNEVNAQYALQLSLKLWLFIHIPATWVLLIFAFFHSMLVHAWLGGLS